MADPATLAGLVGAAGGVVDILGDLFGGTVSTTGTGKSATSRTATQRERLNISQEAINKIIEDVLGGAGGLAEIFAGEQTAGIFDSSVAAEAAGDLATKLAGEIAKLTAEKEITQVAAEETVSEQKQEERDEGILSGIGDFFGF